MVSENTRKVCSFLLYWTLSNSIKDIVINKVLPPSIREYCQSPSYRRMRILVLLLLVGHSYHLFFKTGFNYMLLSGVVMYVLQSLPMPLFIVYGLNKTRLFKNISYAEFRQIARAFKAFEVLTDEMELAQENNLIAALDICEQSILLKLGADLEDLPLFKNDSSCAYLKKDSLQSIAMEAFVKTGKPFPFPWLPNLKMAHDIAKQRDILEKTPIDIHEEFINIQRLRI